ncbi:MAG: nucleotidyltransferase family protein [Bacteroidota bacterium]|nr:nucleotidyltransferase family protein [Bacteroidota bacterium]
MEALILAGGLGTRLQGVVSDVPKSMAPIAEKPFLDYQLSYLKQYGITKVVLAVGYKKEVIENYFGENYKGIAIEYSVEEQPLGTGGAIFNALNHFSDESFFVLNGDTLFDIDLLKLKKLFDVEKCDAVMALRKVDDVSRYGTVSTDVSGVIDGFFEKNKKSGAGLINGGIYLINRKWFNNVGLNGKFSVETDIFEKQFSVSRFCGIACSDYFLDIGIPKDYDRAQQEFKKFKNR